MSGELQPRQSGAIAESTVSQTGTNNLNIENRQGGIININYTQPQLIPDPTAETMLAIQQLSRQYYQLIVTGFEIFKENSLVVEADRALTKDTVSDDVFEKFSTLSDEAREALTKIPAIICNENTDYHGVTDPAQLAIFARIKKIKVGRGEIKIYFQPLAVIPQHKLIENYVDFDLHASSAITDLNRSRWTIKEIDFFEACEDAGIVVPKPM